ncbi:MAG: MFS transporter [bacterium]|nr:MAG: MFS transporter [bacterium]
MDSIKQNKMYRFLAGLTIAAYVGMQGWRTIFNNFAVEVAGLEGNQVGMIQSVREIPGFLALLAVFLLLLMREHRLSVVSVLTLGIGVGATGFFPGYIGLMITTLIMSLGFHYYETTNQSLTLQYFNKEISPWVFGRLRSLAAASNIGVGLAIFLLSNFLNYQNIYLILGLFIIILGIWGVLQDPTDKDITPQHKRMIFRKKYTLFYFLTFMAGARRQIFVAFAVFLLVKKFQFSIQEITLLFVINNVINYFLSPVIGKAIIRFGERKVLSTEYFSLIFIFITYALTDSKFLVSILYIIDHILFNFSIAIRTYFQKIGDTPDIAPSMAMGFTINHIAAVFIPAIGGILWMLDYRIPFYAGAGLSLISLAAVQWIRTQPENS